MTEPATSGVVAATTTTAATAGIAQAIQSFGGIPLNEFIPGTVMAMIGAVGWQFIAARAAREKSAQDGMPLDKRPTVDLTTVGYSIFSAPLVAGTLMSLIHVFGGDSNLLSIGGFLMAGAAGPTLVQRVMGLFLGLLPKTGGQP